MLSNAVATAALAAALRRLFPRGVPLLRQRRVGGAELYLEVEISEETNEPHPLAAVAAGDKVLAVAFVVVGAAAAFAAAADTAYIPAMTSVRVGVGVCWVYARGGGGGACVAARDDRGPRERLDFYHVEVEVFSLVLRV